MHPDMHPDYVIVCVLVTVVQWSGFRGYASMLTHPGTQMALHTQLCRGRLASHRKSKAEFPTATGHLSKSCAAHKSVQKEVQATASSTSSSLTSAVAHA